MFGSVSAELEAAVVDELAAAEGHDNRWCEEQLAQVRALATSQDAWRESHRVAS